MTHKDFGAEVFGFLGKKFRLRLLAHAPQSKLGNRKLVWVVFKVLPFVISSCSLIYLFFRGTLVRIM